MDLDSTQTSVHRHPCRVDAIPPAAHNPIHTPISGNVAQNATLDPFVYIDKPRLRLIAGMN
jgi:hypothetical protein